MSAGGGGHHQTFLGLQEAERGWSDWNQREDGSGNLMNGRSIPGGAFPFL